MVFFVFQVQIPVAGWPFLRNTLDINLGKSLDTAGCCRAEGWRCFTVPCEVRSKEVLIKLLEKANIGKTMVILFFCHFPVGMLVAVLIPDNVMDYGWAQAYTCSVADYFPIVSMVVRCTSEPSTAFMAALLIPITSLYWIFMAYEVFRFEYEGMAQRVIDKCKSRKNLLGVILSAFFFPYCTWFVFFDEPTQMACPTYHRTQAMINSKFGMAVYGMMYITGSWWGLFVLILAVLVVSGLIVRWVNVQQENE